jgi:LysM repeat protein
MAYTIKKGDTLNKIAAANGISLPELLALNPNGQWGSNPDLIQPGWTVNLPGDTAAGTTPTTPTEPPFDPEAGIDKPPVDVNGTTVPAGGRLVTIKDPTGSDDSHLYYIVYEWKGIELAYEIGGPDEFLELFGTWNTGMDVTNVNQAGFDELGLVTTGSADQIVGSTESVASQIERELSALGLEDLPEWMASNPDTLVLLATATAQEWSSGRLWQELSETAGFQMRYGAVLEMYQSGGQTIGAAVAQIEADENALLAAIRPFLPPGSPLDTGKAHEQTTFLQELMLGGWTPGAAAQVLEQADVLRSDPTSLAQANAILEMSGLGSLNEVEFLNALAGFGAPDVVEALNTAAAGTALVNAGLDDVDLDLLMEIVDTSGQLLTVESFASLAQELAFNTIRFAHEIDENKLGFNRDDLIAAAFGQVNPNGKTPGEVINALGRFQRDRQAAGTGFEQTTGFQDEKGRLRIAGLGSL